MKALKLLSILITFAIIGFTSCQYDNDDMVAIEKIELSEKIKNGISLKINENIDLHSEVSLDPSFANTKINYLSSNEKIIKVNGSKIIAVSLGETTIIVKAGKRATTFKVAVVENDIDVESVILADDIKDGVTLNVGLTLSIADKVSVMPVDASDKTITYTSSEESIATVDKDGLVTALAAGSTVITVEAGGKKVTFELTVTEVVKINLTSGMLSSNLEVATGEASKGLGAIENLLDGKGDTFWAPAGENQKRPTLDPQPILNINLGEVKKLARFEYMHRAFQYTHVNVSQYKIEVKKAEADAWVDLGTVDTPVGPIIGGQGSANEQISLTTDFFKYQPFSLNGVEARFVKITLLKTHPRGSNPGGVNQENGYPAVGDIALYETK